MNEPWPSLSYLYHQYAEKVGRRENRNQCDQDTKGWVLFSLLLQQSHDGSRYNKGTIIPCYLNSGSTLAAGDAASLGSSWHLNFGEPKHQARVRFT